jgi:hypothetical protein
MAMPERQRVFRRGPIGSGKIRCVRFLLLGTLEYRKAYRQSTPILPTELAVGER